MKNFVFTITGVLIAFMLTTCKEDVKLNGARVNPKVVIFSEDSPSQKIYVYLYPTNPANTEVRWESSSESVITVTQDGVITPAGPGDANVIVYQGDRALDTCKVTVTPVYHVQSVIVDPAELTLTTKSIPRTITATIVPANATYPSYSWSSSDETVVTVDFTGLVKPVGVGTATITATAVDGGHTGQCAVTVTLPAPAVNLLQNQGFESGSAAVPDVWIPLPNTASDWWTPYYGTVPLAVNTVNFVQNRSDATIFAEGANGYNIRFILVGNWAARVPQNGSGGFYQIVDVTPGATYVFGANVGFYCSGTNIKIKAHETIKILSADNGLTTYATAPIKVDPALTSDYVVNVRGLVTIPEGVTKIRFQIDQRDFAGNGNRAPLMLFDDCVFQLDQ